MKALLFEGNFDFAVRDITRAEERVRESRKLARETGNNRFTGMSSTLLAFIARTQGDYRVVIKYFEESLKIVRELNNRSGIPARLDNLSAACFETGQYTRARELEEEALQLAREMDSSSLISAFLSNLGYFILEGEQPDYARAEAMLSECLELARQGGLKGIYTNALIFKGLGATYQRDYDRAWALFEEAEDILPELIEYKEVQGVLTCCKGITCYLQGNYSRAEELLVRTAKSGLEIGAFDQMRDSLAALLAVAGVQGQHARVAWLAGVIEALLARTGMAIIPRFKKIYQESVPAAQSQLGETEFDGLFEQGKQLPLEEAIKSI
jgi:tetratricopeptide (TPR) repeat protein